jgi:hypothetical protein
MHIILDLIDRYWKFDENQQPISSWHDKQDLLKEVEKELIKLNLILAPCPSCGGKLEETPYDYVQCEYCEKTFKVDNNGK